MNQSSKQQAQAIGLTSSLPPPDNTGDKRETTGKAEKDGSAVASSDPPPRHSPRPPAMDAKAAPIRTSRFSSASPPSPLFCRPTRPPLTLRHRSSRVRARRRLRRQRVPAQGELPPPPCVPRRSSPTDDSRQPCCVCKEEKSKRDECMLFSTAADPAADCRSLVEQYKSCMLGFGYKV